MVYAPVVIPTLCRAEHFKRCLESLANNVWAEHTAVFVALDYPAKRSHGDGHAQIMRYLHDFDASRFAALRVIERDWNYGASANFNDAVDKALEEYDRVIMAEDDIEFAPGFLRYMDSALMKYRDDPQVDSVCGYSYPLPWEVESGATAFFCDSTFSAWGYGTWREKLDRRMSTIGDGWLISEFDRSCKDGRLARMVENRRCEYIVFGGLGLNEDILKWSCDMSSGIYLALTGICTVVPVVSLVRNHGFDGTGEYCAGISKPQGRHSQDYDYALQPIDADADRVLVVDERPSSTTRNGRLLDSFLYTSRALKTKADVAMVIRRLFGMRGMRLAGRAYLKLRQIVKGS